MKYWCNAYPNEKGEDVVECLSEQEIINQYWDYWYGRMCEKFGKEHVDANYTTQDCIDDWTVVHWAWEVTADDICCECSAPATYIRHTQFAGDHPYCKEHALQQKDFYDEPDSYSYWSKVNETE